MSKAELSRRLAEHGRPMSHDVITKIEACRRPVDTDDLMALALALDVPPNRLLLPDPDTPAREAIQLTAEQWANYGTTYDWFYDARRFSEPTPEELARIVAAWAESKKASGGDDGR